METSAQELRILTGRLNLVASRVVRHPHEKVRKKAIAALEKVVKELDLLSQYKELPKRKKKLADRRPVIDDWRIGC